VSITQDRLKELLKYDPETGLFVRLVNTSKARAGDVCGGVNADGYVQICVDGKRYLAHRLAFLYMTGKWPDGHVDHRHGVRHENRWDCLRDVTRTVNQQNLRKATKANGSGLLGAFSVGSRFKSSIRAGGKVIHLGYFSTAEQAHEAYVAAKRRLHEGCTL
jgi:hypothetical protein